MAKKNKLTNAEKQQVKDRYQEMKDGSGEDKDKHDKAIAVDASFAEKHVLVDEVRKLFPGVTYGAASMIAEEYYNQETNNREADKKAAMVLADDQPKEDPVFPTKENHPHKRAKGWDGPAVKTINPRSIAPKA